MQLATSRIAQVLDPLLQEDGFTRTGLNWYRYGQESILLVNVQSPRHGMGPYINLGVYYYKYGDAREPAIVDCHISTRLTSLVSTAPREMELLDVANDVPDEARRRELSDMMRVFAIPWIEAVSKIESARYVLASRPSAAHVAPVARADLRVQMPKPRGANTP